MIGKKVKFYNEFNQSLIGVILDKYIGLSKTINEFPSINYGTINCFQNIPVDFYLIQLEDSLISICCGDIKEIIED